MLDMQEAESMDENNNYTGYGVFFWVFDYFAV
jgi:hypothetical protein